MKTRPWRRLPAVEIVAVLAGWAAIPGLRATAADWPQWQGPERNAISRERGLLQQWPKEGPPLAWKITGLGGGPSTPSIGAGRIFGMSHRGADEVVWAVSETDGAPLWATRLGPAFQQDKWGQAAEGPHAHRRR
jgi:hypothetical protein